MLSSCDGCSDLQCQISTVVMQGSGRPGCGLLIGPMWGRFVVGQCDSRPCSCDLSGRLTKTGMWAWRGGCFGHCCDCCQRGHAHTMSQWFAAHSWRRRTPEEQKDLFSQAQSSVKNTSCTNRLLVDLPQLQRSGGQTLNSTQIKQGKHKFYQVQPVSYLTLKMTIRLSFVLLVNMQQPQNN